MADENQKAYRDQEIVRAYDRERKRVLAEREAARKNPRQIAMGGLDPDLNARLEGSVAQAEEMEQIEDTPSNASLKKKSGFPWIHEGITRTEWLKRKEEKS